ncbi:MAG: BspA family leucine-rich repeat surface protein, partial [Clostridia bacterium]|nr:BspA family leucine-rich repeat surface protein [Clostridia bacterium]
TITSVSFDSGVVGGDLCGLFAGCSSLTAIYFNDFDTSSTANMSYMFSSCSTLQSIDLSGFCTIALEDITCMFSNCLNLSILDISSFNLSEVAYGNGFTTGCTKLSKIIMPKSDTNAMIKEGTLALGGYFVLPTDKVITTSAIGTNTIQNSNSNYFYNYLTTDMTSSPNEKALFRSWTISYDKGTQNAATANNSDDLGALTYYVGSGEQFTAKGSNKFTLNGIYELVSWNTVDDGTGTEYALNTTITASKDLTLYAIWSPKAISIVYHKNSPTGDDTDVSGTMANQNSSYLTSTTLSSNSYSISNYTFAGWSTTENGSYSYYNSQSITESSPLEDDTLALYAVWKLSSYLTINVNYNETCSDNAVAFANITIGGVTTSILLLQSQYRLTNLGEATVSISAKATINHVASVSNSSVSLSSNNMSQTITITISKTGSTSFSHSTGRDVVEEQQEEGVTLETNVVEDAKNEIIVGMPSQIENDNYVDKYCQDCAKIQNVAENENNEKIIENSAEFVE